MDDPVSKDGETPRRAPRPRGRPSRISRDQIIAVTLDMLCTEGFEAFSMARLAARMKASPMALYTYFPGRDALLDAVADSIFCQFQPVVVPENWQASLDNWLLALCDLFARWPVALKLIRWDEHISPAWLRAWLPMVRMMHSAGLEGARLSFAASWFSNMAMALVVSHVCAPSAEATAAFLAQIPEEDLALVESLSHCADGDQRKAVFDCGVETVMQALERMIATAGGK